MTRILLLFALFASVTTQAQIGPGNEPPLPQLKGVKMVVKRNIHLEPPQKYGPKPESDTNAILLIGKNGMVHTEYSYVLGTWNTKKTYEYQGTNLVREVVFENKDKADLFKKLDEKNMESKSRTEFEYKDNRAVAERYYCCQVSPGLTRATFFTYDNQGRIIRKVNKRYTIPGGLYWGSQLDDSTLYRHQNDTVYATRYDTAALPEKYQFYQKLNEQGRLLKSYDQSSDGAHFESAVNTYDKKGRLLESLYGSDRAAVQPNGIVLRADKIIFSYDEKGRIREETSYAEGKARWKYLYIYIE